MKRSIGIGAALCAALAACTPMRMGESQATLDRLLVRQAECDRTPQGTDGKALLDCANVKDSLAKLASELAVEARKMNTSAPNAVFFYRRAATAAWRSEEPKAMDSTAEYADEGISLCGAEPGKNGIPPGDCALLGTISSLALADRAALEFKELRTVADGAASTTEKVKIYQAPSDTAATTRVTAPGVTRLGASSQRIFTAWVRLSAGLGQKNICGAEVHDSVRKYVRDQETFVTGNLKVVSDIARRTVPPQDADPATYAEWCESLDRGGIALKDIPGKMDLTLQVHRWAWCRWKWADDHKSKPEACNP